MEADVTSFFDPGTFTYSYIIADPVTWRCAIIDPVLDFDPVTGKVSTASADRLIKTIRDRALQLELILETHVHADHLTAAAYIKKQLGGTIGIGSNVPAVQQTFGPIFNAGADFLVDGSQFDHRYAENDSFSVGGITFSVLHTPGHTPACITYVIPGAAFVGDTLFMPDYGTARTDFPGGDAGTLYDSVQKILSLPDDTTLYMCHDYLPPGRTEYVCKTTVAAEKKNIHLAGKSREQFISERQAKDATLAAPRLLLPSIQVNMRAGELPPAEDNDVHYIKIPVRVEAA